MSIGLTAATALAVMTAWVDDDEGLKQDVDSRAIEWAFPGEFAEARRRSKEEQRILMIKGVSFGIDEVGLVEPTKGEW